MSLPILPRALSAAIALAVGALSGASQAQSNNEKVTLEEI